MLMHNCLFHELIKSSYDSVKLEMPVTTVGWAILLGSCWFGRPKELLGILFEVN